MSTKKSDKKTKQKLQRIEIDQKPTLVLGSELMNLTNFFHNQIKKEEWSGILFYTVEGSIRDIDNLTFRAEHMMLKDIGTSAYTSYEFDADVLDYFDENPDSEPMKMGMIHTHHDMRNFFSSTDLDELEDNAPNHNYYLSLIMSHDCDYSAKLAIYAKSEDSTVTIKDEEGKEIQQTIAGQDIMYIADCDIVFELDSYNLQALEDLKKKKKQEEKQKSKKTTYPQQTLYGYGSRNYAQKYSPKKNPLSDDEQVAEAIVGVLYCDPYGTETSNITPELAFKKMNDVLGESEIEEYVNNLEQFLDYVIGYKFGGSELHIEEFADSAIVYINKLNIKDNKLVDEFVEMLKFHSSEFDDVFDEEEVIIT